MATYLNSIPVLPPVGGGAGTPPISSQPLPGYSSAEYGRAADAFLAHPEAGLRPTVQPGPYCFGKEVGLCNALTYGAFGEQTGAACVAISNALCALTGALLVVVLVGVAVAALVT